MESKLKIGSKSVTKEQLDALKEKITWSIRTNVSDFITELQSSQTDMMKRVDEYLASRSDYTDDDECIEDISHSIVSNAILDNLNDMIQESGRISSVGHIC